MKKIIALLIITVAVAMLLPRIVSAQSYLMASPRSFIDGTNLTANVLYTTGYGLTNIYYESVVLGGTNTTLAYTNANGIVDVPLWINADEDPGTSYFAVRLVGSSAEDTNTWTFVLTGCPFRGVPSTAAADKLTTTVTANGTTEVCIVTNRVWQGCSWVRLTSVTPSAGTKTNTIFKQLAIVGGTP